VHQLCTKCRGCQDRIYALYIFFLWFPCQKHRMYSIYIWFWPTRIKCDMTFICQHYTLHMLLLLLLLLLRVQERASEGSLVAWQRWVAWAALCITCGGLRDVAVRMSCLTVIIACLSFTIAWCGCEDELCSTLRAFCASLRGVAVRMSCVQHCVSYFHHCVVWLWGWAALQSSLRVCGCEDELPYSHHCVPFVHHCVVWLWGWAALQSSLRAFCSSLRGVAVRMSCVQHCVPFVHHCVVWLWGWAVFNIACLLCIIAWCGCEEELCLTFIVLKKEAFCFGGESWKIEEWMMLVCSSIDTMHSKKQVSLPTHQYPVMYSQPS